MFELGPPRGGAVCFHWRCGFIRRVLRRMERRFRLFEAIGRWRSGRPSGPCPLGGSPFPGSRSVSGYCFGRLMLRPQGKSVESDCPSRKSKVKASPPSSMVKTTAGGSHCYNAHLLNIVAAKLSKESIRLCLPEHRSLMMPGSNSRRRSDGQCVGRHAKNRLTTDSPPHEPGADGLV